MKRLVFISYCHVDSDRVDLLAKRLQRNRVDIFLDKKSIDWGQPIAGEVTKALTECVAVLVVISPASLQSQWVPYEIGHAMGTNAMGDSKQILPFFTHRSLVAPQYIADLRRLYSEDEIVQYFKSDAWRVHCEDTELQRKSDLIALRRTVSDLARWLRLYLPGGAEPEEL
jgi:hypothetical protein